MSGARVDRALLAAEAELRRLDVPEMVDAAVKLILEGEEGMNLAALAGAERDLHPADARELFAAALTDLGVARPTLAEATWRVCVALAAKARTGANPLAAAREIVDLFRDLPADEDAGLDLAAVPAAYYHLDHLLAYEGTDYAVAAPVLADAKAALVRALADLATRA